MAHGRSGSWHALADDWQANPKWRHIDRRSRGLAKLLYSGLIAASAHAGTCGWLHFSTIPPIAFFADVPRPKITVQHLLEAGFLHQVGGDGIFELGVICKTCWDPVAFKFRPVDYLARLHDTTSKFGTTYDKFCTTTYNFGTTQGDHVVQKLQVGRASSAPHRRERTQAGEVRKGSVWAADMWLVVHDFLDFQRPFETSERIRRLTAQRVAKHRGGNVTSEAGNALHADDAVRPTDTQKNTTRTGTTTPRSARARADSQNTKSEPAWLSPARWAGQLPRNPTDGRILEPWQWDWNFTTNLYADLDTAIARESNRIGELASADQLRRSAYERAITEEPWPEIRQLDGYERWDTRRALDPLIIAAGPTRLRQHLNHPDLGSRTKPIGWLITQLRHDLKAIQALQSRSHVTTDAR